MSSMKCNELCELAKKTGAVDAKPIATKDVVVKHWVLLKCKFGCGSYGTTRACPPYLPDPEEFKRVLEEYQWGIMCKFDGDTAAQAFERSHDIIVKIERELLFMGYYSAFGIAAGPCQLCEECDLKNCKNPDLSRPSLEGLGVDVYATVSKVGFDIEVRKDENEKATYYGLLLVK